MSNAKKRKQDDLLAADGANTSNGLTTSLFGDSGGGTSLTSALFGETSEQNDLFLSTNKFEDAVKDRMSNITSKSSTQQERATPPRAPADNTGDATILTKEDIIARRKKQAASSFLNDITSLAPFPVDYQQEAAEKEEGNDDMRVPPDVCVEEIADIVRMHGFAVVQNVVPKSLLNTLSERAKEIEQQVCSSLDNGQIQWRACCDREPETFRFYEVASRCKGRMDVRHGTDQEPFTSRDVMRNKSLRPIIDSLLGGTTVSDASHAPRLLYAGLILSLSGSDDQPWHQDGMPLFPELAEVILPPYAINVFLPLTDDDASVEAGPTKFIPASHLMEEEVVLEKIDGALNVCGKAASTCNGGKGAEAKEEDNDSEEVPGVVSPLLRQGDALLYDYRVCHRGTSNLTGKTRRILYLMYARPWFKEHLNFGSERLFPEENGKS